MGRHNPHARRRPLALVPRVSPRRRGDGLRASSGRLAYEVRRMDLSRAPLPDEGSADVEADAKATTNPLDSFGLLRDRLRCGECGRLTIPRRPLLADMARFVDEVPTSDECATC